LSYDEGGDLERMKKRKGKIFYQDSDLQKGMNTQKELLIKILSK